MLLVQEADAEEDVYQQPKGKTEGQDEEEDATCGLGFRV